MSDLFAGRLRAASALPVGILAAVWLLAVAMNEASRLAEATPTSSDRAYSIWEATGLLAPSQRAAWLDWWCSSEFDCTGPDQLRSLVAPFVIAFVVLQFVLVAVLAITLLVYFRPDAGRATGRKPARRRSVVRRLLGPAWLPVYALLSSTLVSILAIATIVPGASGVLGKSEVFLVLSWVVTIASSITWAALALSVVALLVDRESLLRTRLERTLRPILRGIRAQRVSLLAVIVIAIIGTASGHGVLEQVPDVERGWFLTLGRRGWDGGGFLIAVGAFVLVGIALWFIGRQRATVMRLAAMGIVPVRPKAPWSPWFGAAIVVAVGAAVVGVIGVASQGGDPLAFLDLPTTIAFVATLLALVFVSWAIGPRRDDRKRVVSEDDADAALLLADILPALFVTAFAVSMVKAYFGPLLLGDAFGTPAKILIPVVVFAIVAVTTGPLFVAATPRIAERLGRFATLRVSLDPAIDGSGQLGRNEVSRNVEVMATADGTADKGAARKRFARGRRTAAVLRIAIVVLACAALAAALIVPRLLVPLGPIGVMVVLLGSWIVVFAFASMWLGSHRPLAVFERLGLRTEPLLILAFLIPLVLTQTGGPAAVHALRNADSSPLPTQRPTIAEVVNTWPGKVQQCARQLDPGRPNSYVRPIVFAAAEGGGIRAAEWTWDVLDAFRSETCSRSAVAMSSGVSGGAVGLALMHQNYDNPIEEFSVGQASVVTLAIEGLLVRDAIASLTGIRVPSYIDGRWVWEDRASLIESQWRGGESDLDETFNEWRRSPTGYTVFNSLAANLNCKVVVSQVDLNDEKSANGREARRPVNCYEDNSELSTTIDLVDYLDGCPLSLDWATAAMTAARFPYVTPAGRISGDTIDPDSDRCENLRQLQLIDGGYFENSGLATFSDAAPQIVEAITRLNRRADGSEERPYVMPVVMFMHNEPGGDVVSDPQALAPEIAVPVLNFGAGAAQSTPDAWLARLSDELGDVCTEARVVEAHDPRLPDGNCDRTLGFFRGVTVPHGVVVVAPSTTASLSVPLGWTLSGASEQQLIDSVQSELRTFSGGCASEQVGLDQQPRFYATLGDLMCALTPLP